jgi:hypothetical protein
VTTRKNTGSPPRVKRPISDPKRSKRNPSCFPLRFWIARRESAPGEVFAQGRQESFGVECLIASALWGRRDMIYFSSVTHWSWLLHLVGPKGRRDKIYFSRVIDLVSMNGARESLGLASIL